MQSEGPSAKVNNESARKWIDERDRKRPFFLFLHYYDIHRKVHPPPPYNRAYCETCRPELDALIVGPYGKMKRIPQVDLYNIKALYDGEIRYVDDCMGELFDYLKQQKIYKDALIMLVSDHGEGFLEHGLMDHWQLALPGAIARPNDYEISRGFVCGKTNR